MICSRHLNSCIFTLSSYAWQLGYTCMRERERERKRERESHALSIVSYTVHVCQEESCWPLIPNKLNSSQCTWFIKEYHLIQTLTTVIKKSQINLELLHKYTRTPLHLGKILERSSTMIQVLIFNSGLKVKCPTFQPICFNLFLIYLETFYTMSTVLQWVHGATPLI